MFEKFTKAAERLAAGAAESRRGFLARVGKLALGTAGAVAGLLAVPAKAQAGGTKCCLYIYTCRNGVPSSFTVCPASSCPKDVRVPCGVRAQLAQETKLSGGQGCTANCA